MKNLTVIIGQALMTTTLVLATPAWAQDPDLTPAQRLFAEGKVAVEEKRLPDALKKFSESYKLDPQPKTAAWLGRVQVDLGDYIAGATNLETYLREEKELPEKARQNVLLKQTEAKAKIVTVQLKGTPSDATVLVDKLPLEPKRVDWPIFLVPGGHSFEVQKTGCEPFRQELTGKPGDESQIEVKLTCAGPKNGGGHEVQKGGLAPLAIVGFAVSGGLLVTSAITGGLANSANAQAADTAVNCEKNTPREECINTFNDQFGRSRVLGGIALASLGVGIGVGIAALVHTIKAPKGTENAPKTSWLVAPTPGGVLVQGTW